MPLTPNERYKVCVCLGYSWRQTLNPYNEPNRAIGRVLEEVDNDATLLAMVQALLVQIEAIDNQMFSSDSLGLSGIKQVDKGDVIFKDGAFSATHDLAHRGRMMIARLSILIDMDIRADYYGVVGARFS